MISINGGPEEPGHVNWEYDGRLYNWHGEVYTVPVGMPFGSGRIRVMAFANGHVQLGEALVTDCEVSFDGQVKTRFSGDGPLRFWSYEDLAKILDGLEG